MEALEFTAAQAERYLAEGVPGAADLLAREALARNPRDAAAWRALSKVAAAVGEADASARYERIAAELSPAAGPCPAASAERFLVIKAWGYGFCSDLEHVLGALLLCEITGRTPVTHWGINTLFGVDPRQDAFKLYFEPLSWVGIDDLVGKGYDFWPPKWRETNLRAERVQKQFGEYSRLSAIQYLNRPEAVAVSDYFSGVAVLLPWLPAWHPMRHATLDEVYVYLTGKYLRPVADIAREVDDFASRHFTMRPVIGVHIRGADKYLEDAQLEQKLAVYPQAIEFLSRGDKQAKIFLMTDSSPIVEDYRRRYGDRLIVPEAVRTDTKRGLHYQEQPDRRRLGVEVLRDVLLAARCDRFAGLGTSNVSCMVHHMKKWGPGDMAMIGPMMSAKTEPILYMSYEQLSRYLTPEKIDSWRKNQV
jgi:protein O-GlcNAc transferase